MKYGHKAKTPLNKKNQKIEKRNNENKKKKKFFMIQPRDIEAI